MPSPKHLTVTPENVYQLIERERIGFLATIWHEQGDTLMYSQERILHQFCENFEFDKDNYEYFKSGVASVLLLFEAAQQTLEAEARKLEREKEN